MSVPMLALVAIAVLLAALAGLLLWQRPRVSLANGRAVDKPKAAASAEPEPEPWARVTLLYGTQTGTAERFAKQLKSELLLRYGEETAYKVEDIEEYGYQEQLTRERLVFFLMATYGDGEPTDNAADFFNWLVKAANAADQGTGERLLQGLSFGVFGLGNKQYEHFCAVGIRVHKALLSLGATPVIRRGDGDDDEDIEADFDTWRAELYTALDDTSDLIAKAKVAGSVTQIMVADITPSFDVEILSGAEVAEAEDAMRQYGDGSSVHSVFGACISVVRDLHSKESTRCCLHVELDVVGSGIRYEPGDHVGILPENEAAVVQRAAAALGLPVNTVFRLRLPEGNPHKLTLPVDGPMTLKTALGRHADLVGPMSKPALQALAAFADGEAKARLLHLLSPEGQADYKAWHAQSRSLLEVLEEFPSIRPPLGAFFGSIAGKLQVRFYSISSSQRAHPSSVHVTCSFVEEVTATGRSHRGVCSSYLQRCCPGDCVPIYVRRSTFKVPPQPSTPLIMVGPGTGLAPFRGFLQERTALLVSGATLGPAHLFFGCRRREHDFLYEAELAEFLASGALTHLHLACSRASASKDYVQHHLLRKAADIWPLIKDGGNFYVCGEAKNMAKDVHRTLHQIAEQQLPGSALAAEEFVQQLNESNRYQKDVW